MDKKVVPFSPTTWFVAALVIRFLLANVSHPSVIPVEEQTISNALYAGAFNGISGIVLLCYARYFRVEFLFTALVVGFGFAVGGRLADLSFGYQPVFLLMWLLAQITLPILLYRVFAKQIRNMGTNAKSDDVPRQ